MQITVPVKVVTPPTMEKLAFHVMFVTTPPDKVTFPDIDPEPFVPVCVKEKLAEPLTV